MFSLWVAIALSSITINFVSTAPVLEREFDDLEKRIIHTIKDLLWYMDKHTPKGINNSSFNEIKDLINKTETTSGNRKHVIQEKNDNLEGESQHHPTQSKIQQHLKKGKYRQRPRGRENGKQLMKENQNNELNATVAMENAETTNQIHWNSPIVVRNVTFISPKNRLSPDKIGYRDRDLDNENKTMHQTETKNTPTNENGEFKKNKTSSKKPPNVKSEKYLEGISKSKIENTESKSNLVQESTTIEKGGKTSGTTNQNKYGSSMNNQVNAIHGTPLIEIVDPSGTSKMDLKMNNFENISSNHAKSDSANVERIGVGNQTASSKQKVVLVNSDVTSALEDLEEIEEQGGMPNNVPSSHISNNTANSRNPKNPESSTNPETSTIPETSTNSKKPNDTNISEKPLNTANSKKPTTPRTSKSPTNSENTANQTKLKSMKNPLNTSHVDIKPSTVDINNKMTSAKTGGKNIQPSKLFTPLVNENEYECNIEKVRHYLKTYYPKLLHRLRDYKITETIEAVPYARQSSSVSITTMYFKNGKKTFKAIINKYFL